VRGLEGSGRPLGRLEVRRAGEQEERLGLLVAGVEHLAGDGEGDEGAHYRPLSRGIWPEPPAVCSPQTSPGIVLGHPRWPNGGKRWHDPAGCLNPGLLLSGAFHMTQVSQVRWAKATA
jgi:hypothetical protein